MGHGSEGEVLSVGRRTRTIPPALRRALEARDGGCRFPACGLRFTDAHHVKHWADGGETSLDNCILLCRYHHRLLHEGGWSVMLRGKMQPIFYDPKGSMRMDAPRGAQWWVTGVAPASGAAPTQSTEGSDGPQPPDTDTHPVSTLLRDNRRRGANPGAWTASARWERESDIPDAVRFRASEAACPEPRE